MLDHQAMPRKAADAAVAYKHHTTPCFLQHDTTRTAQAAPRDHQDGAVFPVCHVHKVVAVRLGYHAVGAQKTTHTAANPVHTPLMSTTQVHTLT
jgi:hypothetical protein